MEAIIDDNQLFKSAHAAMTFAFNYEGMPALSVMNRMAQEPSGMPGKGLSGIDGSAQAGIIRYKLQSLGFLSEAILIADIAPRSRPCSCRSPCCSGHTRNQEWSEAINWISDNVRVEALDGHKTTHPLRRACVEMYFGVKHTAVKMAHHHDVSEQTAGLLIRKVKRYLSAAHEKARIEADDVLDCYVIK